MRIVQITH